LVSHNHKAKSRNRSRVKKSRSRRPSDLIAYSSKRLKAGKPVTGVHIEHHNAPFQSVRETEYKGHKITIYTQYQIIVDGKPFTGHISVDNKGKVSAHSLPNYAFVSAVDLVRNIIDEFPDDFTNTSHHSHTATKRRR
jgi:hypothetical protein